MEQDVVPEDDGVPVLAENWISLMAFRACETQWRVAGVGHHLIFLGLDYVALKIVSELEEWSREIWQDVLFMEAAALPKLNEVD